MLERTFFVFLPMAVRITRVEYLRMKELLGLDLSKVFADFSIPLLEDVCLREVFDENLSSLVSVSWLCNHMLS